MSEAYSPEALARQIVVRYRGAGHIRFALPAALCEKHYAAALEQNLRELNGVYRVVLYRHQGKLSVFYQQQVCSVHDVACSLHAALKAPATRLQREARVATLVQQLHVARPLQWLRDKRNEARTKLRTAKTQADLMSRYAALQDKAQPLLRNMLSEKAIINFLNDVVVFYLVKVHWELINNKWLKQPLKYGNAWLATFYLVFLLMRSRKQAARKP